MDELIILALNSGSSSLKFGLYRWAAEIVEPLLQGDAGEEGSRAWRGGEMAPIENDVLEVNRRVVSPAESIAAIMRMIVASDLPTPMAIGHRIVHGGPGRRDHFFIEHASFSEIERGGAFAPLHVAAATEIIVEARRAFPDMPHVACLDTAFHKHLPEQARTLPIDPTSTAGVERYGFHGLSCASIVHQLGKDIPPRLIVAHLGSGASVTAIRDRRSVDTSMGMTPTGGMMMATRSGDLDPGVLLYLMRERGFGRVQLEDLLDRRSGMLGVSRVSGNLRELRRVATLQPAARLAISMFAIAAAKQIAMMMVSLGGVDAVVFTGGIGENDAAMRATIIGHLAWSGLAIDPGLNEVGAGRIDVESSPPNVYVLPSKEQEEIVRSVATLIRTSPTKNSYG